MSDYVAPPLGEHVPDTVQHHDYPTQEDAAPIQLPEPDWSETNPVPVVIVSDAETPQFRDYSSDRFTVQANDAAEIAGAKRTRTRLLITNNDETNSVFIDKHPLMSVSMVYEIRADQTLEMFHNQSVWARCSSGQTADISVIQEYDVDMTDHG